MPAKKEIPTKKEEKSSNAQSKSTDSGIKDGDTVVLDYVGKLDDGTVFDASEKHGKPLEFKVGGGMLIKGFENGVLGMKKGEEKTIRLTPSEGYGESDPKLVRKFSREQLPKEPEPQVGMVLTLGTPDGRTIFASIKEVFEKEVMIDLNHPLAGQNISFEVKIVDVNP